LVSRRATQSPRDSPTRSGRPGAPRSDRRGSGACWATPGASSRVGTRASDGEELPSQADALRIEAWLALPLDTRRAALQAAFGLTVSRDCPPFETEFCKSRDPFHRAQHMADLCGFFRAFAVEPDPASPERHDHVANHLSFVALLLAKSAAAHDEPEGPERDEHRQVCADALRAFVADHAAEWIPTFATALHRRCADLAAGLGGPLGDALSTLAGVAHFMRAWIALERLEAGVAPVWGLAQADVDEPDPDADECGLSGNCRACDGGSADAAR